MTYEEVKSIIEDIGLPTAYWEFQNGTATSPPFICWLFTDSADFMADDTNYVKIRPLRIELYTDAKDFALEQRVENALTAAGLRYDREEGPIESERMYMVAYATSVIISGGNDNGE